MSMKKLVGKECTFTATVDRLSLNGEKLLLLNLAINAKVLRDHVWVDAPDCSQKGAVVTVVGTVVKYQRFQLDDGDFIPTSTGYGIADARIYPLAS